MSHINDWYVQHFPLTCQTKANVEDICARVTTYPPISSLILYTFLISTMSKGQKSRHNLTIHFWLKDHYEFGVKQSAAPVVIWRLSRAGVSAS